MNNQRKRFGMKYCVIWLLAFVMLLSTTVFYTPVMAAAAGDNTIEPSSSATLVDSGTHGTCTWEFYSDGTLIVRPTEGTEGVFPELETDSSSDSTGRISPWNEYCQQIYIAAFRDVIHAEGDQSGLFRECFNMFRVDLSGLDTTEVTSMSQMFYDCFKMQELDFSSFNTGKVTDMSYMFSSCGNNMETLNLESFDTSNVTNMSNMFCYCDTKHLNLSSFNTSNVTDMSSMFSGCRELEELDVSHFDTKKVTNMDSMFEECRKITSLDISNFDTSNVTDMNYMFHDCRSLKKLDVSHFDVSKTSCIDDMFDYATGLQYLKTNFNYPADTLEIGFAPDFPIYMEEKIGGKTIKHPENSYIPVGPHIFTIPNYVDPRKTSDYFLLERDNNNFNHNAFSFFNFTRFSFPYRTSVSDFLLANSDYPVVINLKEYVKDGSNVVGRARKTILPLYEISSFSTYKDNDGYARLSDKHGFTNNTSYEKEVQKGLGPLDAFLLSCLAKEYWNGSCFGIAYTAILCSEGRLTEYLGNKSLYDQGMPKDNTNLRDVIMYYSLLQNRPDFIVDCKTSSGSDKPGTVSLSEFLERFVSEAQNSKERKEPFIFSYFHGKNGSGHAVVVCGYYFDEIEKEHVVVIYNENDRFGYEEVRVSDDYQSFEYYDGDEPIHETYKELAFIGVHTIAEYPTIASTYTNRQAAEKESGQTSLALSAYKTCKVTNAEGKTLICDGEDYYGDMEIYDYKLTGEEDPRIVFTVNESDSFTVTGIEDYGEFFSSTQIGEDLYLTRTNGAGSIILNQAGVSLDGEEGVEYDFEISQKKDSEALNTYLVKGNTSGKVESALGDNLTVDLENASEYLYVSVDNEEEEKEALIEENVDHFTADTSSGELTIKDKNVVIKDISDYMVFDINDQTYTGKALTPAFSFGDGYKVLIPGEDYDYLFTNNKNAGTAKLTLTGKGLYTGTFTKTFRIKKAANPLVVKAKKPTIKYTKLKKKAQTITAKKAYAISKQQGKLSYKLVSVTKSKYKKYFKVNTRTGKITVRKGLKKGTYKVKVKVTASGNVNYNKITKTVTVRIKVR